MSTLPPEVWHSILRFSTYVPQSLSVRIDSQITSWDWATTTTPRDRSSVEACAYRNALITKTSLVLVCRVWFEICIRFLYEDVRFPSLKSLRRFGEVIAHEIGGSYGEFVKRLHTPKDRDGQMDDDVIDLICDIVRSLPNLMALHVAGPLTSTHDDDRLARTLKATCPKLGYIYCNHWKNARDVESRSYLALPQIETARVIWGRHAVGGAQVHQCSIHALSIGFEVGADFPAHSFHFPCLRVLSIQGRFGPSPGILNFLNIHGLQIHSLQLSNSSSDEDNQFEDDVVQRCLSLRELIILRLRPRRNVRVDWVYSTVIDIGISLSSQRSVFGSSFLIAEISRCLEFKQFPSLRRIVVVDLDWNMLGIGTRRKVAKLFANRGDVLFEDGKGILIPDCR